MKLLQWSRSLAAAALAALAMTVPARTDSLKLVSMIPCADAHSMGAMLRKFDEKKFAVARDVSDVPMLITVNPKTATFTVLLIQPSGLTCILAAGKDFSATGLPASGEDL